jgi:hypothetical protein
MAFRFLAHRFLHSAYAFLLAVFLPSAYCLLLSAFCFLPTIFFAYCLLPTVFCYGPVTIIEDRTPVALSPNVAVPFLKVSL